MQVQLVILASVAGLCSSTSKAICLDPVLQCNMLMLGCYWLALMVSELARVGPVLLCLNWGLLLPPRHGSLILLFSLRTLDILQGVDITGGVTEQSLICLSTCSSTVSDPGVGLSRNPCAIGRYACDAQQTIPILSNATTQNTRSVRRQMVVDIGERLEALIRAGNHLQSELLEATAKSMEQLGLPASLTVSQRYCLQRRMSRSLQLSGHGDLDQRISDTAKAHLLWRTDAPSVLACQRLTPAVMMLRLRFFISSFNVATCRTLSEMEMDRYHDGFVQVVDLIRDYFANKRLSQISSGAAAPVLEQPHNAGILDFCIVSSLLIVASKCRASALRHKALDLLRDARRMQGIRVTAELEEFAHAIVELEEDKMAKSMNVNRSQLARIPDWTADQVPEETRFSDVVSKIQSDIVVLYLRETGELEQLQNVTKLRFG